jgi:MFS family permease
MKNLKLLFRISIFWFALSLLADGMNTLVLPNLLIGQVPTGSQATALGLLSFAGLILGMLIQPYAGAWSDRLRLRKGRRGALGVGVLLSLAALTILGGIRDLAAIIIGYALLQMGISIAQAAQQGFIPDLVSPSLRGRASGLKSFMDIGGAMLGFVVLGQLLGNGRLSFVFLLLGGTVLAGFLLTAWLVHEPHAAPTAFASSFNTPNKPLLTELAKNQPFFWLIVSRFLFLLATYAVGRFLLFFVSDRLALPENTASGQTGSLLAVLAFVTVIAAVPAGWAVDRFGRKPCMVFGGLVNALGVFLLIFGNSFGAILLFGSLMSLGSAAFASSNWAMAADLAPSNRGGWYFGLLNIGTAGAAAAAGLFGPLIDDGNRASHGLGYTLLFALAALISLGSVFVLQKVSSTSPLRSAQRAADEKSKYPEAMR